MLASFKNKTVIVRRLRAVSGNKRAYYATTTAEGTYQNVDPVQSASLEGIAGKTYKAWFDLGTDIKKGDRLTDANTGVSFTVLAVETLGDEMGLSEEHLEVMMTRYDG